MTRHFFATALAAATLIAASSAQAKVYLQGINTAEVANSLNALGVSYVNLGAGAMSATPGAGDLLVMSFSGGNGPFYDYTAKLNQGLDILMFGGSNLQSFRDWASLYFNLTDTAQGWHINTGWRTVGSNAANQGLPLSYTLASTSVGYHMLGFAATPNTTMLATNEVGVNIAAFREYANGGSFNYLSNAVSFANNSADQPMLIQPYVRAAMAAANNGLTLNASRQSLNEVAEPSTLLLVGAAGAALLLRRRRLR